MKYMFKKYCINYTEIENYELAKADNFKGWECHHRLETHDENGNLREKLILHTELKEKGLYWFRPASELIFLARSVHKSLHSKGKNNTNFGKHLSEETKRKISEKHKGLKHTDEWKKHHSEIMKQKHWKTINGKRIYY